MQQHKLGHGLEAPRPPQPAAQQYTFSDFSSLQFRTAWPQKEIRKKKQNLKSSMTKSNLSAFSQVVLSPKIKIFENLLVNKGHDNLMEGFSDVFFFFLQCGFQIWLQQNRKHLWYKIFFKKKKKKLLQNSHQPFFNIFNILLRIEDDLAVWDRFTVLW